MTLEFPHDELEEEKGRFGGPLVFREIAEDAPFLFAAEGWICQDDVYPVFVADLPEREPQTITGINLRGFQAMQEQIHLAKEVRKGLGIGAKDSSLLQRFSILDCFTLALQVLVGFHNEAACAAGRVEDRFSETRIGNLHHKAHDRARCVELSRITGGISHFLEHRLVKMTKGVNLV